jgi:aldehyde:ferredoxin oxidoreductase
LCNLYGLDPVSLGGVLGFAAECVDKGVLSGRDLGFDFGFGRADEHILELTGQIAHRRGLGATLAEGVRRAAAAIGQGSERFAMHVKGVEMTFTEPRCQTNLALGFALAPNGPQGDICEHDWDFDTEVGWSHTLERTSTLGIFNRVPMAQLCPEKVKNFKVLNWIWSGCDGINLCPFVSAPTRYFRLTQMAQLIQAVTGWDFSSYELMRIGERRNALMRFYNYREGFSAADDTLPERFYDEPIRSGRHQGARIGKAKFKEMLELYYSMVGWDRQGRPINAKLHDLNLDWLATPEGL